MNLNKIKILAFLLILAGVFSSCIKSNLKEGELDEKWAGRMRVKIQIRPQIKELFGENYLATEDPEIIAILQKHDVGLYRTYPDEIDIVLLQHYTLIGKGVESKDNSIKDLFATGKFEEWFDETWSGMIKLKPQENENYLATRDPEMISIINKHGIKFYRTWSGTKDVELLLYYTLEGTGVISKENAIRDLFATGKFEEWYKESGMSYAL